MSERREEREAGTAVRLVASLLRPLRRRALAALAATLTSTAAALVPPYLAGRVVNDVVETGSSSELIVTSILLAVALLAGAIASGLESWLIGEVGQRALMDLRTRIVAKLHVLPIGYFDRASTGGTVSRVTNDVESLNSLVSGGLNQLISAVLVVIGTALAMILLDWRMALVVLFVFPFLVTISLLLQGLARPGWRTASDALGEVTGYVQEGLAGRAIVRGFGQEDRHVEAFERVNADNEQAHKRPVSINLMVAPAAEAISLIGIAAVIAYAAHEVSGGAIEVGLVVSFLAYLRQALAPLQQLAELFASFQTGIAAIEELSELLELPEDPGLAAGRRPAPALSGAMAFERVSFGYEPGTRVLEEIELEITAGESVAFVGSSGSGKSTMVKLAVGFYAPEQGRITLDGQNLSELDLRGVRRQIGYVPQEPFLFMGTVADNIVWSGEASIDRAREAAEAVGALEALERLPDGLGTEVGERGERLSIGQRQLVALARATASDPRLLVLDEATSNIDSATEAEVKRGIDLLLAGRTSIVVAHRLSTIRRVDKLVVLEQGRIAEAGTPAELRAAGGHFAALERQYEEG